MIRPSEPAVRKLAGETRCVDATLVLAGVLLTIRARDPAVSETRS